MSTTLGTVLSSPQDHSLASGRGLCWSERKDTTRQTHDTLGLQHSTHADLVLRTIQRVRHYECAHFTDGDSVAQGPQCFLQGPITRMWTKWGLSPQ